MNWSDGPARPVPQPDDKPCPIRPGVIVGPGEVLFKRLATNAQIDEAVRALGPRKEWALYWQFVAEMARIRGEEEEARHGNSR